VGNLLSRKEAASYIKSLLRFGSVSMLAQLARTGDGPIYYRAGKATVYPADALESWCLSRLRVAEAPVVLTETIAEPEPITQEVEAYPDDEPIPFKPIYSAEPIDFSAIEAGLRLTALLEGA
jgi:hypothetical protein